MKYMYKASVLALSAMMVTACGQKGPLYHADDAPENTRTRVPQAQTQSAVQQGQASVSEAQSAVQQGVDTVEVKAEQVEAQKDGVVVEDALSQ